MAQIVFIVFDQQGNKDSCVKRGIGAALWRAPLEGWRSCFDFYLFNPGTNLDAVQRTTSVLPVSKSIQQIETLVTALRLLPLGADLGVAVIPRIEVGWITFNTALYCPRLTDDGSARTAVGQLAAMVTQINAAYARNCRLFVGPEGYFFKGTPGHRTPYTAAEMAQIEAGLALATAEHDLALVIAGTIFWVDDANNVHNSLLAFSGGTSLLTGAGRYEKRDWTGDELAEGGRFGVCVRGAAAHGSFVWAGFSVCTQICQDSATNPGAACDIHAIVGDNTGFFMFRSRQGGVGAYADAVGQGRAQDVFGSNAAGTGLTIAALDVATVPTRR
jgi:carbon-nitrogen hydrolase